MNMKINYYYNLIHIEISLGVADFMLKFGPYSYPHLMIGTWSFEGDNMFNRAKYELQSRSWKTFSNKEMTYIRCIINYLEAVWEDYRKNSPSWITK